AQAERPQLAAGALRLQEGVVLRDGVALALVGMIDVEADDAGVEIAYVLAGVVRVGVGRAVARGEVEHAVGAEAEVAAVVAVGLVLEDQLLRREVALRRVAARREPPDLVVLALLRVGAVREDVDVAVLAVIRMERHAVEIDVVDLAEIEGRLFAFGVEAEDAACLLDHEYPVVG